MINQNSAHHLRRHTEKVRSALPIYRMLFDQLEISLMNQSGGLQSVVASLMTHVASGQTAQLPVDQGDESGRSPFIAVSDPIQEDRDIAAVWHLHLIHFQRPSQPVYVCFG